jgi:hypothetical protein
MSERLRLQAKDADDLRVIAAMLQDAIVPLADVAFLKDERTFLLLANRFCWEKADTPPPPPEPGDLSADVEDCPYQRTHCAVRFDGVTAVRYRDINRSDRTRLLSLLTIEPVADGVVLTFAGGAAIRLEQPDLACLIEDVGEPWPTARKPGHDGNGPGNS